MSCLHCGDWYKPERGDTYYECKKCHDKWIKIGEEVEKERQKRMLDRMKRGKS